ncbi:MAG: hypothetical protein OXC66_12740 [Roseovarius sp.]|nr:hypothetical protein [Roseovarius sp.]
MDLMQIGVNRSLIALWLGHERIETTQIHVEATLAMNRTVRRKRSISRKRFIKKMGLM